MLLAYIVNPLLVCAISPLMIGIIRKVKAYLQNRHGASIFQPYYDLMKLFKKDEIISEDASWIFRVAPYIVFGTTIALATGIPFVSNAFVLTPMSDILVVIYTLAAGTFFLALAGMDVGGGFGGFGASREMTVAALAEGGLLVALVAAAFIAGTMSLSGMHVALASSGTAHLLPLLLAAGAFFVALLAENARFPFDNPATHLELTMIHEAMILEYSGKRLALMEWAASNKLILFSAIFANIFIPWGMSSEVSVAAILSNLGLVLLKILCVGIVIGTIESTMAKFRFFRLPDLLFTSFIISIIAVAIISF
jgi:formate hydrogenlyase subunit 4